MAHDFLWRWQKSTIFCRNANNSKKFWHFTSNSQKKWLFAQIVKSLFACTWVSPEKSFTFSFSWLSQLPNTIDFPVFSWHLCWYQKHPIIWSQHKEKELFFAMIHFQQHKSSLCCNFDLTLLYLVTCNLGACSGIFCGEILTPCCQITSFQTGVLLKNNITNILEIFSTLLLLSKMLLKILQYFKTCAFYIFWDPGEPGWCLWT